MSVKSRLERLELRRSRPTLPPRGKPVEPPVRALELLVEKLVNPPKRPERLMPFEAAVWDRWEHEITPAKRARVAAELLMHPELSEDAKAKLRPLLGN